MAQATCSIDRCERRFYAHGWCEMHHARWRRNGTTDKKPPRVDDPVARFWEKVDRQADGCWLWTAYLNEDGYGEFWYEKRAEGAHRVAYILFVGPIPDGLTVDHLCRVRRCVNPDHMELVPPEVNSERQIARLAGVTHCAQGHEFNEANTRHTERGWRVCRACERERMRGVRAAKREAV